MRMRWRSMKVALDAIATKLFSCYRRNNGRTPNNALMASRIVGASEGTTIATCESMVCHTKRWQPVET